MCTYILMDMICYFAHTHTRYLLTHLVVDIDVRLSYESHVLSFVQADPVVAKSFCVKNLPVETQLHLTAEAIIKRYKPFFRLGRNQIWRGQSCASNSTCTKLFGGVVAEKSGRWMAVRCVISSGTDLEMPETAEKQTANLLYTPQWK